MNATLAEPFPAAPWRGHRRAGGRDRGSATVEIAIALPSLVLVLVTALWAVLTAAAEVACVDAVRAGARAAARGESLAAVREAVAGAAPPGARVEVSRGGQLTTVSVTAEVRPPIRTGLPPVTLHAHALAATEPGGDVP